jgi:hypothetical protein
MFHSSTYQDIEFVACLPHQEVEGKLNKSMIEEKHFLSSE